MAAVRTPDRFEADLARFLYERAEEARAVRVGEKETSEQAAIVERYADLFTRDQHAALRGAEEAASGEEGERLFRLRESCEWTWMPERWAAGDQQTWRSWPIPAPRSRR